MTQRHEPSAGFLDFRAPAEALERFARQRSESIAGALDVLKELAAHIAIE